MPGFIFISVYGWLNNKEYNISIITIWSLFISNIIILLYSSIHTIVLKTKDFNESFKSLIFIVTALIIPFIITWLCKTKLFSYILFKTNNKSINSDIFNDIIDYDKKTIMRIYMKNSPTMYIGTFKIREEKGIDSYIVLIDYASVDISEDKKKIIFKPEKHDLKSSVVINLRDIERIELVYERDSKVLERLGLNDIKRQESKNNQEQEN